MAHVSLLHVAAGCNRVCHALHWGDNGLVAFASHRIIIVWDPEVRGWARESLAASSQHTPGGAHVVGFRAHASRPLLRRRPRARC